MGTMALKGTAAFNTQDPEAWNSHARLIRASEAIQDDVQLAAMFRVSVPTVRKWRLLPLGYQPGKHGRRPSLIAEEQAA